jgi:hypothetical protein
LGVNVIFTSTLCPAVKVVGSVIGDIANCEPLTATLVNVTLVVPLLVSVTS